MHEGPILQTRIFNLSQKCEIMREIAVTHHKLLDMAQSFNVRANEILDVQLPCYFTTMIENWVYKNGAMKRERAWSITPIADRLWWFLLLPSLLIDRWNNFKVLFSRVIIRSRSSMWPKSTCMTSRPFFLLYFIFHSSILESHGPVSCILKPKIW